MKVYYAIILIYALSFPAANCQSFKEMIDNSNVYQEKKEFRDALYWSKLALIAAEKEYGKKDTNYTN